MTRADAFKDNEPCAYARIYSPYETDYDMECVLYSGGGHLFCIGSCEKYTAALKIGG
jgi:hypothetical protein